MAVNTTSTLSAAVEGTSTGGSSIVSAEVQTDGRAWMPMQASDGTFDEPTENVRATIGPLASAGGLQAAPTDGSSWTGAAT